MKHLDKSDVSLFTLSTSGCECLLYVLQITNHLLKIDIWPKLTCNLYLDPMYTSKIVNECSFTYVNLEKT